jgi:hypothetical protein
MLPTVVPSLTVCAAARVSVVPGAYVAWTSCRRRSSVKTNLPPPAYVMPSVSLNSPVCRVIVFTS